MKIAVFHNQPSGGARRALHGFCRFLSLRHRVDIFTLTTADQEMLRDEDVATSVTRFPFAFRAPIRGGSYLNDVRRWQSFDELDAVNLQAAQSIDSGGYDVALIDACRFTFAPALLGSLRTPSAYYCHHRPRLQDEPGLSPPQSLFERVRRGYRLPLERRLERRLWRQDVDMVRAASKVFTNSLFTQQRISDVYGVQATVCPPGVDLPQMPAIAAKGHVLSVGELERRKGFDLLIEAVALLEKTERPALRIIANGGHPRVRAELEQQARRLDVNLTILILPPQEVLARAYRESLVFAYGAHEEALGLAPLEAMSYGIPVVAVAEGGVVETVGDGRTGFLTERDAAQFSARLRELIKSPPLRAEFGRNGRQLVAERWQTEHCAARLEANLLLLAERGAA